MFFGVFFYYVGEGATNFILFSLHCVRVGKSFFNKNEKKMSCNFFCLESEGVKKSHLQKKKERRILLDLLRTQKMSCISVQLQQLSLEKKISRRKKHCFK